MAFRRTLRAIANPGWIALVGALVACPRGALAAPVTIPSAVADAIAGQGQGLCVASAVSTTPNLDFGALAAGTYNAGMNAFMEAHKADRTERVLRSIFDLSNNNSSGLKLSYGDFVGAMTPACGTGGCDLFVNDTTTSFGSRFRGFINVRSDLVNTPVHLGFYADDAVSLVVYDKNGNGYPVITQPPILGAPTWRVTETITFAEEGLYPLEILYVEIVEHVALEMSYYKGVFSDFQRPANQVPVVSLETAGFTLFPRDFFFQTISGAPSYPDLGQCEQCDRQFVGQIGNNGCDQGYYCNEAALCAPCDTAYYCGPTCSPCGGMTPFCVNGNAGFTCVSCRDDKDCKQGFSCDPVTHVCNECNVDDDCARGKTCIDHACLDCATPDKCAGNSCNCCPKGQSGDQMECLPIGKGKPECVECTRNSDCNEGVCDVFIGQCVPELAKNEKGSCCGDDCLKCPADNPLCLPGPYGTACARCRNDTQCPAGEFCYGGQCTTCNRDRRCGPRCTTCSGETPFCLDAQVAEDAACVRCLTDDQCDGGRCNKETHTCSAGCEATCGPDTPFCDGDSCVECFADTQCPCAATCDLATKRCSASCKNNGDCLGDQHCAWDEDGNEKSCELGALPDNVDCGGTLADICGGGSIGARSRDPAPRAAVFALALSALAARRRLRRRR